MKAFEATGVWFLPDDTDLQIPGTLTFDDGGRFLLRLSGSFQQHWNIDDAKYPIICGSVSETPYGKFITLFDSFATNIRFGSPGSAVEVIHSNYGFAGTAFVESTEMEFDRAAVYFSALASWLAFTGIKYTAEDDGTLGFAWRRPEAVECSVDGATVRTGFEMQQLGGPLGGTVTIQETPALVVDQFGNATADQIHERFFAPLSNLLTFASDGKSNLDRYKLYKKIDDKENSDHFDRLYSPAVKYEKLDHRPRITDLLFSLKDVRERFQPFMQKWFAFVKSHPSFCTVFFSYGYEEHGFVDTRFTFQMLAVECLIRENDPKDKTLKAFDTMRSNFLKSNELTKHRYSTVAFPSAIQMALPTLIGKLLNQNWSLIEDLVGTTEERFIESLFATLEHVSTRSKTSDRAFGGTNLYRLYERLTAVLKVLVLKQLDFSDEEIRKIVTRNSEMHFVRSLKAPWEPEKDDE